MLMGCASLVAVAALVVLAGVSGKNETLSVNADQTGLTLNLTSANGLTSSDNDSSTTYAWNTDTSNGYHTSWSATGVTYGSGHFLHIALNKGEFHNTVTLHQITQVLAIGTDTGSSTASLSLYTSSDGTFPSGQTAITLNSGTAQTFSATDNIGYLKFEYNRDNDTTVNYVTSGAITYNCVA
jgi:hypothetical protein